MNATNNDCNNALWFARFRNHPDLIDILTQAGIKMPLQWGNLLLRKRLFEDVF